MADHKQTAIYFSITALCSEGITFLIKFPYRKYDLQNYEQDTLTTKPW